MLRQSSHGFTAVCFLAILAACAPDDPPTGPNQSIHSHLRPATLDASAVIASAIAGSLGRGEEDLLVRLENKLPGFGGLYIANGEVRIYMKRSAQGPSLVRDQLVNFYRTHPNPRVREAVVNLNRATILAADYSLSELIAIENRIASSPVALPGWVGTGASITRNRVVVMFKDSSSLADGLKRIESIGVPVAALSPMVVPEIRTNSGYFITGYRPTGGGLQIRTENDTREPGVWGTDPKNHTPFYYTYATTCSLGFNVRTQSGLEFFMTAGHCEVEFAGVNGATGDTAIQASRQTGGPIGTYVINPPYDQGAACPFNPATLTNFDFCTNADVALGSYFPGVTHDRKVGTSTYGGVNGNPGQLTINNFWPINGVLSPEYVDSVMHHDAAKSGRSTGTTSGPIIFTIGPVSAHICFSAANQVCNDRYILLRNATTVQAVSDAGDSGAPVFTGNPGSGAPYAAIGILIAGTHPPSYPCSACTFVLARWDQIEARLGLGSLLPQTN